MSDNGERALTQERDAARFALADLRLAVESSIRALGIGGRLPRDPAAVPFSDEARSLAGYLETALTSSRGVIAELERSLPATKVVMSAGKDSGHKEAAK